MLLIVHAIQKRHKECTMRKAILVIISMLLFGCSGGHSSTPSAVTVSGVAATGAAVSGTIFLKDSAGHELSVVTPDGTFTFDVSALSPPFMLKANWNGQTIYSFSTSAGTANITPMTQMIVAAAANGTDLDSLYFTPSLAAYGTIATNLPTATTSIRDALQPLLSTYDADIDPISGTFAANGAGMDSLLDHISVTYGSGTLSVTDKASGSTLFTAPISPSMSNCVSAMSWDNDAAAIAQDPDLKVSKSGDALVVWWQYSGAGYTSGVIKARWLGSETATQISSSSGFAMMPKVAVDAAGNAIVVWMQSENQLNDVWVNRYVVNSGWGEPIKLTTSLTTASGPSGVPSIAIDSTGNAVIMWNQSDESISSHFDVFTSRYSVATGSWSAPAMLSNGTNCAYGFKVVANGAGKAAVIYNQYQRSDGIAGNGDASDIWVATGTTSGGFATHVKVSSSANLIYGQASLAVDPDGDFLAAWIQNNNSGYFDMWVSRRPVGGSWEAPNTIGNSVTGACYFPEVEFDASGNAFATWVQQSDSEERQYVAARRYTAGGAWSSKTEISENTGNTFDQHLAVDSSGNATVVWYQIEPSAITVRSARYLQSSGWGTSQLISSMGAPFDGYMVTPAPRIAVNPSGKSFVIWGKTAY